MLVDMRLELPIAASHMIREVSEFALFQFQECRMHAVELEAGDADGAVSMLFNEDFSDAVLFSLILVSVFSMNEHNHVGILLDGS